MNTENSLCLVFLSLFGLGWLVLKILNALADWEVFFAAVFLDNEKASGLWEFWVGSHLERFEILGFFGCSGVEFQYLLHKICVRLTELNPILHIIQNCSWLRLDLIYVHVVDTRNRVWLLLPLYSIILCFYRNYLLYAKIYIVFQIYKIL